MTSSTPEVPAGIGHARPVAPPPAQSGSDAQFRELVAHLQQVFWIKNAADDAVMYISPAYETVSGRTCQSLYDNFQTFLDAIHPDDRARVTKVIARQRETRGYDEEYRILRPDGTVRWIWARSYPVCDGEGAPQRFAGIAEDITEHKALEHDRARLAAIIEYSEDAFVCMSLDGTVISWNDGAERRYGYTAEEMVGRPISVLFPPDHYQEYVQTMRTVWKGEAVPSYETVRQRKDGTLISLSVSISPIEAGGGETVGASTIAHDITKVRKLEAQFRQAQKLEAMGQLAVGVAHDINNMITAIAGYSELLLDELPADLPAREMLQEIRSAGERAAALTRQLLSFSRKQLLDLRVVDLNAVVANGEPLLRQLAGASVAVSTALCPALGRVRTDAGQMEQALINLVINARDAMPRGGKLTIETANATLDETCGRSRTEVTPGRYVMLAVGDTGCGMDAQTRDYIFEPFFTTKEDGKGTGLGLAMVHGFVKQTGGHIFVYSEPELGSTFKIYLPEVEDALTAVSPQPPSQDTPRGTETILLAEDDASVRSLAQHILRTYGYTVLGAAQGDAAIQIAETHQGTIALLVTDVVMPGMGGRRLAERIAAIKPGIKVLFLSGYADDAVVRHGIPTSELSFLQKPFTLSGLVRKVRRALDHSGTAAGLTTAGGESSLPPP